MRYTVQTLKHLMRNNPEEIRMVAKVHNHREHNKRVFEMRSRGQKMDYEAMMKLAQTNISIMRNRPDQVHPYVPEIQCSVSTT